MQTHNLQPRTKNTPTMIVGRGGKRGKTSGRGTKGQNARAGHKNRPELRDFIKRIPKLRGRGISPFKSYAIRPVHVSLSTIEKHFSAGAEVTPKALLEKKLIEIVGGITPKVKIVGGRTVTKKTDLKIVTLSKKVVVSGCLVTTGAKAAIEKAGGTVSA